MSKLTYQIWFRYFSLVIFLALPIAAFAFFGTDQKYDGFWVSQDKTETISIQKNDKSYLIVSSSEPGKKLVGKLGADGVLTVEVPMARLDFVFESKTGNLIGGGKTFIRAKAAPKFNQDEYKRWVLTTRYDRRQLVFGDVRVDPYAEEKKPKIANFWQPGINVWDVSQTYIDQMRRLQAAGFVTVTDLAKTSAHFRYASVHRVEPTTKFTSRFSGRLLSEEGAIFSGLPPVGKRSYVPLSVENKIVAFDSAARTVDNSTTVLASYIVKNFADEFEDAFPPKPSVPGLIGVVAKLSWDVRSSDWVRIDIKPTKAETIEEIKRSELYKSMWNSGSFLALTCPP